MPSPHPPRPSTGRPPRQPGQYGGQRDSRPTQQAAQPLPQARDALTDANYVDMAEKVMQSLQNGTDNQGRAKFDLTTSKLRNLLSLSADIFTRLSNSPGTDIPEDVVAELQYLRVQFVYQAGRESAVRELIDKADMLKHLQRINTKAEALRFCRFMEALAAYKKYLDLNDK